MASEETTAPCGSRKPAPRFTSEEKSLLLSLVNNHKKVLECKKTDVASLSAKTAAWKKLAVEYNAQHGVTPRDPKQLKKCWGNMKQKWKEENSEEKRKIHKTGGGPAAAGMTPLSALVGAVAGHMATRIPNEEDSDGATYLPPVDSEPVVRLLQPMITGEVEATYDYYGIVLFHETHCKVFVICRKQFVVAFTFSDAKCVPHDEYNFELMILSKEHRSPGHLVQHDHSMDNDLNATSSPIVDHTTAAPELLESNKENEPERAREFTSERPPRSRMALLEKTLASENEVRIALLREEQKLRMRLMQEEHADNLKKRNDEHKLKIEILNLQKQVELAKLNAMNKSCMTP
nr:myb/SANT-like DNA-binding domain-containing protein 3 [Dermacentor andersoni]